MFLLRNCCLAILIKMGVRGNNRPDFLSTDFVSANFGSTDFVSTDFCEYSLGSSQHRIQYTTTVDNLHLKLHYCLFSGALHMDQLSN